MAVGRITPGGGVGKASKLAPKRPGTMKAGGKGAAKDAAAGGALGGALGGMKGMKKGGVVKK